MTYQYPDDSLFHIKKEHFKEVLAHLRSDSCSVDYNDSLFSSIDLRRNPSVLNLEQAQEFIHAYKQADMPSYEGLYYVSKEPRANPFTVTLAKGKLNARQSGKVKAYDLGYEGILPPISINISMSNSNSNPILFKFLISVVLGPNVENKMMFFPSIAKNVEHSPFGAFQIYEFSTPYIEDHRTTETPSNVFGFDRGRMSVSLYHPETPLGVLITDENGHTVGEVLGNALYIYCETNNLNDYENIDFMAALFMEASKVINSDVDWSSIEQRRLEMANSADERAFRALLEGAIPRIISRNRDEESNIKRSIQSYEEKLFKSRRRLANFNASLDKQKAIDSFTNDYKSLREGDSKIETVSIRGDALIIKTHPLVSTIQSTKRMYDLGRLEIKINFGSDYAAENIKLYSIDKALRVPHTAGSGSLCSGTIRDDINSYVANYEISAAASIVIALMERGIDPDDEWGGYITKFPEIYENPESAPVIERQAVNIEPTTFGFGMQEIEGNQSNEITW